MVSEMASQVVDCLFLQNEAVHGFDSLSVLLVQIISICLIITEWMAKVKEGDRDWSRDLSLCVADDFLYVYDVSVLFDFRLHDGEVCNRSLITIVMMASRGNTSRIISPL